LSNLLDQGTKQLAGVDLKVGFNSSDPMPAWEPSPYDAAEDDLLESRKFSDLPVEVRKKVDVIFGITGRRKKNHDNSWDETLVPKDIDFLLSEGESKCNELWLVSGSTKTKEFELVKDFVEKLSRKGNTESIMWYPRISLILLLREIMGKHTHLATILERSRR